jgi:hypothetical protein
LAQPNYSFQKRQRDLAKKKKREEKLQKKITKDRVPGEEGAEPEGGESVEGAETAEPTEPVA